MGDTTGSEPAKKEAAEGRGRRGKIETASLRCNLGRADVVCTGNSAERWVGANLARKKSTDKKGCADTRKERRSWSK